MTSVKSPKADNPVVLDKWLRWQIDQAVEEVARWPKWKQEAYKRGMKLEGRVLFYG